MRPDNQLTSAVLKVGDGRGFVIKRRMNGDRIVITAAHCLPFFPEPHPAAFTEERTYKRLLGPLGAEPTVMAELLFADPIADIAALGAPDGQVFGKEVDAYEALVAAARPLTIAEAPPQRGYHAAECEARVLSLDGRWRDGRVERRDGWLSFSPEELFEGGMSGSPIITMTGEAIGVASTESRSPVLVDSLSTGLLRSIKRARPRFDPAEWEAVLA